MRPKRNRASRQRRPISKTFYLPAERLEHNANASRFQAVFLARRFGLARPLARVVADLAFGAGRRP